MPVDRSSLALALATAGVLPVLTAAPAFAHAGFMPGMVAPGTTSVSLVLAHGCGPDGTVPASVEEALATTAVSMDVPDGIRVEPTPTAGWAGTITAGPDGTGGEARWEPTGPVDASAPVFLELDVAVDDAADGTTFTLPMVQDCGAEQLAWTGVGAASATEFPAPALTVDAAAAAAAAGVPADTGRTLEIALAVAAVAAVSLVGGAIVWYVTRPTSPPAVSP